MGKATKDERAARVALRELMWALRQRKRHAENAGEPVTLNAQDVENILGLCADGLGLDKEGGPR